MVKEAVLVIAMSCSAPVPWPHTTQKGGDNYKEALSAICRMYAICASELGRLILGVFNSSMSKRLVIMGDSQNPYRFDSEACERHHRPAMAIPTRRARGKEQRK